MVITAILMGVGIPSFMSAVQNSRQSSTYQSLIGGLFLARSEAVKRAATVTVCSRATSASCGDATQWNNGWLVFTELEGAGFEFGRLDAGEIVLAIEEEIDQNQIKVFAKQRGSNSTSPQHYIRYTLIGGSNWRGGTLQVCDDRGDKKALAMNVVITGDIRKARSDGSADTTPVDFDGAKVSC